jgi:beta-glucanase (GH16 family)
MLSVKCAELPRAGSHCKHPAGERGRSRWGLVATLAATLVLPLGCSNPPATGPGADPWPGGQDGAANAPAGWTLAWSDEFDGPDGSDVDAAKWTHDVGNNGSTGWGWGNGELEYYTPGTENAVVRGGMLLVTAATVAGTPTTGCWYGGGSCRYTSARINTRDTFSQAYGRFEARIQIPRGAGLWPAFWLLGADVGQAGWPQCGEIDIMENAGGTAQTNHGSLHAPGSGGSNAATLTAAYTMPGGATLADGFHTYAIDWTPEGIWFYVDDQLYETQTPRTTTEQAASWVFDHPFFVILNLAVGGTLPGDPTGTTFPQVMKVDWVRIYRQLSAP